MNEFFGSMINMDDPKHFRLRSIVSKGFTPKEVGQVEENVRVKAAQIVDRLLEQFPDKQCDFVEHVAAALPLEIICDMMGIPAEDYAKIFKWTNTILGVGDPEFVGTLEDLMGHALEMFMYAQALGEDRRGQPARRHHVGDDGRRRRRRPAHGPGVRLVLHPARRRRQRDHPQRRSATG